MLDKLNSLWNGDARKKHIEMYSIIWREEGRVLSELREARGETAYAFAKKLMISPARLRRFEAGEPVRDASLIKAAYLMLLELLAKEMNQTKGEINLCRKQLK